MSNNPQLVKESAMIQKTFGIDQSKVKMGGFIIPAFCYPSLEIMKGWKLDKDEIICYAICVYQSLFENPDSDQSIADIKTRALQTVFGFRKSGDDFNMINQCQFKCYS